MMMNIFQTYWDFNNPCKKRRKCSAFVMFVVYQHVLSQLCERNIILLRKVMVQTNGVMDCCRIFSLIFRISFLFELINFIFYILYLFRYAVKRSSANVLIGSILVQYYNVYLEGSYGNNVKYFNDTLTFSFIFSFEIPNKVALNKKKKHNFPFFHNAIKDFL